MSTERNPRIPAQPSPIGSEITQYFIDSGNWVDEDDLKRMAAGSGDAD